MSFYNFVCSLDYNALRDSIMNKNTNDVLRAISKPFLNEDDFAALLSPAAEAVLENIAARAQNESHKHFGKSIVLYTPMYLSNYCVNSCLYCGFNHANNIERRCLSFAEIENEAEVISKAGLRHILLLTGECREKSSVNYISQAVKIVSKFFDSISLEIYPLTEKEYKQVVDAGVDGLTIYQEVYNFDSYKYVHVKGPKSNYRNRIDAPQRACMAGIRSLSIGVLLGLDDWRVETFFCGLHLQYLIRKYPDVEYSVSIPRIRSHAGHFDRVVDTNNQNIVQIITAYRNFLPFAGINLSTRENEFLRDNLIPLGITRMSAGVSTSVGGHSGDIKSEEQFEISDKRSVESVKKAILSKGYQPILKDWIRV